MLGLDTKLERCARLAETRGRRLAIALVDSPEDADDVLQQALLVAARKANDIPLFSLWPWLARVIAFEAKNLRRAKARSRTTAANGAYGAAGAAGDESTEFLVHTTGASPGDPDHREPAAPPHEDPLAQVIAADLRGRLAAAMGELSEPERDALALVYGGGLSVREAARAAGVPRTTFQRSVDAGLESLRIKLGVSRRAAIGALGGWWGGLAGAWVPTSGGWVPSPTNAGGGHSRLPEPVEGGGPLGGGHSRLPEPVEGGGPSGGGHSCPPSSSIGAQSALSGATTAATSAFVLGGLAMTMKQAMTLGAILVLAGAGIWWGLSGNDGGPHSSETPPASSTQPADTAGTRAPQPQSPPQTAQPPAPSTSHPDPVPAQQTMPAPDNRVWKAFSLQISGKVSSAGWKPEAGARIFVGTGDPFDVEAALAALPPVSPGGPYSGVIAPMNTEFKDCRITSSEGISDDTGKFSFTFSGERLVAPEIEGDAILPMPIRFAAAKEGFLTTPGEPRDNRGYNTPGEMRDVSLRLGRPQTITGKVLWMDDRTPVEGAGVEVLVGRRTHNMELQGALESLHYPLVLTNQAGGFTLLDLPDVQMAVLHASPPGVSSIEFKLKDRFALCQRGSVYTRDLGEVPVTTVTLLLPRLSTLRFRVAPVPESAPSVKLGPHPNRSMAAEPLFVQVEMDSQGLCSTAGLHAGHSNMVLRANGYEVVERKLAPRVGEDLDLGLIVLESGVTMLGRVTDGRGAGLPGVSVASHIPPKRGSDSDDSMPLPTSTVTDADGSYRLTGIGVGERQIRVSKAGFAKQCIDMDFKVGDRIARDFSLGGGGSLAGMVLLSETKTLNVYPGGGPRMPDLHITLIPMQHVKGRGFIEPSIHRRYGEDWYSELKLAGQPIGRVFSHVIEGVPAGVYSARLRVGDRDEWTNAKYNINDVAIDEGRQTALDFNLVGDDAMEGVIRGRVLDWDGRPFAGVQVSLERGLTSTETGDDGTYVLKGLRSGSHRVSLLGPTFSPGLRTLLVSGHVVEVPKTGEAVFDYDFSAGKGVLVEIDATLDGERQLRGPSGTYRTPNGLFTAQGTTGSDGKHAIYVQEPCTLKIFFTATMEGETISVRSEIEVPNTRKFTHTLTIRSGVIVGKVMAPLASADFDLTSVRVDHDPVLGSLGLSRTSSPRSKTCSREGTFRLLVVDGDYIVRAQTSGFTEVRQRVVVRGETHITLQIGPPIGAIEVTCAAISGDREFPDRDWWRIQLNLVNDSEPKLGTFSSQDNHEVAVSRKVTLKALPPGEHVLRLVSSNFNLLLLEGDAVRVEDCDVDPIWAPLGKRWIVTIKSGETLKLNATLIAKQR